MTDNTQRDDASHSRQARIDELRTVAATTWRALQLLWGVGPMRAAFYALVTVVDAVLPAIIAWVAKHIVDAVVAGDMETTLTWVGVECGLVLARSVLFHFDEYLRTMLGARLAIRVNVLIVEKALDLAAQNFEDSRFVDRLARAAKEAGTRPIHLVTHAFTFIREAIRLASFIVLLWSFSPLAVLAIFVGTAPQFVSQTWAASEMFRVQMARTFDERRSDYLKELLLRESFVKEIKLFALGRYLLGRFSDYQERFFEQDRGVMRRTLRALFVFRVVATLTFYGCYVAVAIQAVRGQITLGDMTMLMLVVRGSQESFEATLNAASKVYEGNLYMTNLFLFLEIPADEPWQELEELVAEEEERSGPVVEVSAKSQEADEGRRAVAHRDGEGDTSPEVAFDDVSFTYPGTEVLALDSVSVRIESGETLALVGRNGAGKTTLIKLLARLYEPTCGRITLDGRDVAELSPAEVRRRIGVIFQDFVQYHLTAGENVGVGWLPLIDDRETIIAAAEQGGAADFIEGLTDEYETVLGRYYGGAQLSIGQWQRLALARAFMRRSDLLILDEPTAALDAESEAQLFERFQELKEGRTAILITHRFSTVRFADRIVVLDKGRVVEEGTHSELMKLDGLYATMFNAQAAGFLI
jgi:ATP-binding cassette subfamily B protein